MFDVATVSLTILAATTTAVLGHVVQAAWSTQSSPPLPMSSSSLCLSVGMRGGGGGGVGPCGWTDSHETGLPG